MDGKLTERLMETERTATTNPLQTLEALCRTRTDDPLLTMEGSGFYERSRSLSDGHELPANSRNTECTTVVGEARLGSN
jgi:hypothetical protein